MSLVESTPELPADRFGDLAVAAVTVRGFEHSVLQRAELNHLAVAATHQGSAVGIARAVDVP
jgi:hypothetical protein